MVAHRAVDEDGGPVVVVAEDAVGVFHQLLGDLDQPLARFGVLRVADAVVVPQHHLGVVARAGGRPAGHRIVRKPVVLETEVFLKKRQHPLVRRAYVFGVFVIIPDRFDHNHAGPPVPAAGHAVAVGQRAEEAVLPLGIEAEVDPFHRLFLELRVVQHKGQRDQAARIVRAALPAVAGTAAPPVGALVHLIQVVHLAGQAVFLEQKLFLQPTFRLHSAHRQLHKGGGFQVALVGVVVLVAHSRRLGVCGGAQPSRGAQRHRHSQNG